MANFLLSLIILWYTYQTSQPKKRFSFRVLFLIIRYKKKVLVSIATVVLHCWGLVKNKDWVVCSDKGIMLEKSSSFFFYARNLSVLSSCLIPNFCIPRNYAISFTYAHKTNIMSLHWYFEGRGRGGRDHSWTCDQTCHTARRFATQCGC